MEVSLAGVHECSAGGQLRVLRGQAPTQLKVLLGSRVFFFALEALIQILKSRPRDEQY